MSLRRFFRRRELDQERAREFESHLAHEIDDNLARGIPPDEARRRAYVKFGNPTVIREEIWRMNSFPLLENLWGDARYAVRQLRKSPGFTLASILTLALGIGTATAMFAIVYGVLLQPFPFPHARQLYQPIGIDAKGNEERSASYLDIQQWREATSNSAQIAFSKENLDILDTPAGAEPIENVGSSTNLLSTLGAQPMLGRLFLPQEQEGSEFHVVLLSYAVWRQAFSADRGILGRTVHVGGVPYSVIGVMPPHFRFPMDKKWAQVWTPLKRSKLLHARADNPYERYSPVLRVQPNVQRSVVQAELSSVQAHIAQTAKPGEDVATRIQLASLQDSLVEDVRPALTALEIAVALVWLIACSNVAGLLLARVATRRTEIAVRGALGAGKLRIVRQFLAESLLLSCAGALGGLGMAMLVLRVSRRMLQEILPPSQNIHLNLAVLMTLIGFTLFTGLAFGVFPAAIAARAPEEALRNGGRNSSAGRRQCRLRNLLLVSEVALSIVLLVGAGLMMRTIYSLRHAPLGFQTDHIVLTDLTVPGYIYKNKDLNTAAWQPLLERMRYLPGVQAAGLSTVMPIGHSMEWLTLIYSTGWTNGNVTAEVRAASPDLLQVLGIQIRAGRFFTAQDTASSTPVAVVNHTFVNRYLGGHDALGKQIRFGRDASKATIVGVLEDVRQDAIADPSRPEFYLCMSQLKPNDSLYLPLIGQMMELGIRTDSAPGAMIPELRRAIHQENPNLVVGDLTTMDQSVEDSIGSQRLAVRVIGVFGGLALFITVVGLYGLLTYLVTQRTHEIGIRMALGADRVQVMRMILRKAVVLMATGIAIGLVLTFWSSRLLHSFLYGVSKDDPWTLAIAPGILLIFGIFAAVIPARRAASIEPIQALRME